jgi:CHAD domain-containing protein
MTARAYAQQQAETRKIRHKLKAVMQAASDVRDYDIALDLFKDAGIPRKSKAGAAVDKLRKQAEKKLMDAIRLSSRDNFSRKWRTKLEL